MQKVERLQHYLEVQNFKVSLTLGEVLLQKEPLGGGGNGIVYKAEIGEGYIKNTVAIKFLVVEDKLVNHKTRLDRFKSEYFNVMLIEDNKNIAKQLSYDVLRFNDNEGMIEIPAIIMKCYDSTLAKLGTAKDEEQFIALFKFLTSTVKKIHESGIIHRDIKPENILIDKEQFVLADFGIASYNPSIFALGATTPNGERVANRLFSAPEQENIGIDAHETMDIYAIGQVLQWFATGATHRGTGRERIASQLPNLYIYDEIIHKCLQNDPRNRYQSINELHDYFEAGNGNSRVDVYTYLSTFNRICRSNFPKSYDGVASSNDVVRIDKLLQSFKDKEKDFGHHLWYTKGHGNMSIRLEQVCPGVWKLNNYEYRFNEVWVHSDTATYNDFILFHFEKSEPFECGGEHVYQAVIVDGKHHITNKEFDGGYAEINGDSWDLSEHHVEEILRQEKDGYLFVSTYFHLILDKKNDDEIHNFIKSLLNSKQRPTEQQLINFKIRVKQNVPLEEKKFRWSLLDNPSKRPNSSRLSKE